MPEGFRYRTILLFGMPGSGKGTQGAVLAQLPGVMHISSGDLFRKLPKHGSLSREVMSYTTRGLLVPDDLTIRIFRRHLDVLQLLEEIDPSSTVLVLDGIPRNFNQAKVLSDVLEVMQIFCLEITNFDEARERLASRALRENRLDDASEEVIQRRFRVYEEETKRTLEAYDRSLIGRINASQTPLRVHRDIVQKLCELEEKTQIGQIPKLEPPPAPPGYEEPAGRSALTVPGGGDRTAATIAAR